MTDSQWIQRALETYESPLLRYAVSIMGDLERAREVVQETFLRLCQQKPEAIKGHLAPWLFRVCRNRAIDSKRRQGRMKATEPERLSLMEDRSPGPLEALERKETLSRIESLLKGLSDNKREVLRLKFQSGLSYREISDITGLSESNVGFLIHTAVKTLRERVKTDEGNQSRIRRVK